MIIHGAIGSTLKRFLSSFGRHKSSDNYCSLADLLVHQCKSHGFLPGRPLQFRDVGGCIIPPKICNPFGGWLSLIDVEETFIIVCFFEFQIRVSNVGNSKYI